ncbi:ankyrin repeat-containing protein ITN1-like isoform X5 [Prunus avium]|uniref:Ankyrin repeat-containing protein ITN1-like isoform X5 n=1 Tax=Prunus avium TaxID=42229 RepID=A0A6P5T5T6_PRUAV|nr:ankyrin repeat-containing protein ITN1-like isoform X5 [Prunus avium]
MVVPEGAIVVEVLNKGNYEHWSALVKNYLLAQDLWDVVEATAEPPIAEAEADQFVKAWRKKTAVALHAIQISCGPYAFSVIKEITSAKIAWDTLAEKFKPQPFVPSNSPVQSATSSNNPGYYNDFHQYQPLFDAVWSGDRNKAKEFLILHPNAVRARHPYSNKTALHMAIELEHEHIVEEIVQLMTEEELEIKFLGCTALALAANQGNIKMVECMVRKSKKILTIPIENNNLTPILLACFNEHWDVVRYLYSVTPIEDLMPEKGPYGAGLLCQYICAKNFDMAQELIRRCPQLVLTQDTYGVTPIHALAFLPSAFPSGTHLKFWQQCIYKCIHIDPSRAISDVRLSVQNEGNEEGNRREITWSGMLSPLAKLDTISGAALQMQRELQWFKEVETMVFPKHRDSLNAEYLTSRVLFTKNHKDLVKEGERWMKETATSCTVVGALIITIMFASVFTVPGGNNGETGLPIFLSRKLFMVFIVSDAISLFSSTTSVLMFLGILTSRYAEDDFLKSLPTKMIIGLSTLFISIAAMMVAFSSALFIMIHEQLWIVIPIIFLASVPITLFIWMQFPLLVEIFISTYGSGIFDRKVKQWT